MTQNGLGGPSAGASGSDSPVMVSSPAHSNHQGIVLNEKSYTIIFKAGDDLRQDQLVVQIISLMDSLLKKENLDLSLTPYQVLALSGKQGMIERVESKNLSTVLSIYRNEILAFFREHHPDPTVPSTTYGVSPDVFDNFIKSCAGYCVITYILGIGDRHNDNLLVCQDGRIFHIDFGFIFGKDPKPFPSPMKLTKEMVEAMGGMNSPHYTRFKSYCCEAYNILRKKANLILNLLILMTDSSIPAFVQNPDGAVAKVQGNLRLELSDEEASVHIQQLIHESVSSFFPGLFEQLHKFATTYLR